MKSIWIICIDDEPDVLRAVERELGEIENTFPIETAESAAEAVEIRDRLLDAGDLIGLVLCDHIMPDRNGVDLLIEMHGDPRTRLTRKVLVTGQAGLDATIQAVNESRLDHFLAKPWETGAIRAVARAELTKFIVHSGIDPMPYMGELDPMEISRSIHGQGLISDE